MSRAHWSLTLKRLAVGGSVLLAAAACGGDDESDGAPSAGKSGAGRSGSGGTHAAGTGGTNRGGTGGKGDGEGGAAGDSGGAGGETGGSDGRAGAGAGQRFFSGVVAGYIEGANVFLDLDGDFEPDAKEPAATTDARGRFSLPLDGDGQAENFTVVARVPDSAIDSYTGKAVPNAYVLAAPAGANAFVSPLSSLVVGLLARYPSFSLEEAESALVAKLAVGSDVSLFADYVADAKSDSDTAAESRKLQRAAQVLGWSFGLDLAEIAERPSTPALDAFTLATHNAELELATVALAVADKALDSAHLLTLAAFLNHVDSGSVEVRLDRSRRASPTDFYDTFTGDGAYIPFPGPNGAVGGYGRFRPSPKDRSEFLLPQQDYSWDLDTSEYVAEPPIFDAGYSLTADGWTLRTESNSAATFSSQSDGSARQTTEVARAAQRGTMNVVELSGRLLRSYAKGIDFTDRDARFPKGALGYRMAVNAQKDEYLAYDDDGENPELKDLASLDAVEAAYGPDGAFLRTYSSLNVKLMSQGVVRFSSGRDEMLLPKSGSWRRRTVEGAELIEITVPVAYKSEFDLLDTNTDLFIAVIDGQARSGVVTRAGLADTQDYYFLNRTAFDAVLGEAVENDDGIAVFGQVAAEGWLEGAKVFLDLDDDGRLDAGEPWDTSVSNGQYTLFWSKRDFEAHSVAVVVPANASVYLPDVGRSFSVTQPFSLRAPPGETIITPFTTLAWYLLGKNSDGTYEEAQEHLAGILGTTGSLFEYVDAADAVQTKLRLVAGMLTEKLKEVRGRMLANQTDADAVVLDPDSLTIYRALVGANYETLPGIVLRVEALLAAPNPDADLNDYVDKNAWADIAGDITDGLFEALAAVLYEVVHKMVTVFVAQVAGEIVSELPYVGWFLGPAVKCGILESNGIECGAV